MALKIQDFIDIEQFQHLQDRLNEIYSFPSAIIDNDGKVLTSTAWQDICTKFHRQNSECEKECIKSDQYIASHLHEANPAVSYRCPHGLIDNATPIIIEGVHYGNFFTGQFFLEPPDLNFFRAQASRYGFAEDAYIEAVKTVPVWTQAQLDSYLFFIKGLIEVIAGIGLKSINEINTRKRIKESEERSRTILQTAMDGFWMVDMQGRLLEVNETYCRMSGYSQQELLAMRIPDLEAAETEDNTATHIQKVMAKGEDRFESRHRRKDGNIFDVEVSVQYQSTDGGRIVTFLRDITERKRTGEENRRNQERAERLAEEIAIIAEIGRVAGSTLDINQVFERVDAEVRKLIPYDRLVVNLKKDDHELVVAYASGVDNTGRRSGDLYQSKGTITRVVMATRMGILVQPADAEEIKHLYPNLSATFNMGLRSTMSVPLISLDEVIGALTFRSKKLKAYTEQDLRLAERIGVQIAGAIVNAQLFNDLKKTEKSLRESNELFSLFMRHSPVYTYIKEVTPTQNLVLQASENFLQMIGIPGSEMVGKSMTELFSPEFAAKIITDDWAVVSRGDVMKLDEELNSRSYTTIKFPIIWGDKTLLGGYTIDITDRKRADEEKARLQDQLLQSQKMESVGRLAGGVAHDFNNMLGVILGHVEMAMEQVDPAQPLHTNLQEIGKAAKRSSDLTSQLLAFARKQTVSPRVLDMNEIVTGMLKMLHRLIGEEIHLNWLPGANLWPVKMDPSQIDQILANLCINARDAIAGIGKATIETGNIRFDETYCADHAGFVPGEYVLLAVSDDGCGMGKEILGKLFEPFFTTKGVGEGTGLGLATIYGIVRQNNGFINVYSEPDQGTTFSIYLPRHIGKAEQARTEGPQEPVMRGQETVLVVEDELALLDLSKLMLEKQGYRVLTAGTPGEAIRLAEEHAGEIHLLITDVVMPEMNGRDLAKKMLSLYPDLKRLFMSGYTANVIAHHGILDDGVYFIQKPFSRKDLAAKVREALDQK
jgi:PAS domain S-box-containing protein